MFPIYIDAAPATKPSKPKSKSKKPIDPNERFFTCKEVKLVVTWKYVGQTKCACCKEDLDKPAIE